MAQERQITLEEIARGIDKGLNTADERRGAAFEQLGVARQAKSTTLRREHARLSEKYGADHPRVQAILSKGVINEEMRIQVAAETIRARTEIPFVDGSTWILHGFVRNKDRQGVPDLTVALYDPNGDRVNNLGQACTDANGYFKIISKDANSIGASNVYVRVSSGSGVFLFADKNPLLPKLGRLDYNEIELSGGTVVCVSPPEPPGGPSPQPSDIWVVSGRVTNTQGTGLSNLIVSIHDKDFFFDDRLGQTVTDQNGYYKLSYRTSEFRDLIERKPDIYLNVLDQNGETLYSSKEIRFESGRVEIINVVIAKDAVPKWQSDTAPLRMPDDTWVVNGRVIDAQGNPLSGYLVTVADKDIFRDDVSGTTTTDANGRYTLSYRTEDFRDVLESKPDIYLKVKDPSGKTVYTSKQIWFEAGRVETIDVIVGKDVTGR